MSTQPVTIDLGQIGHWSDDEAPHLAASRRHWTAGRARLWWPAALLSAVLVLASTGAAILRPWANPHLAIPGSTRFALDERHVYVLDQYVSGQERTITAYRLGDGTVRWRIGLPVAAVPVVGRGVLLLSETPTGGAVTAVDPDTGKQLWTRRGSLLGEVGDALLLFNPVPGAPGRPATQVELVDGWTGTTRLVLPGGRNDVRWGEVEGTGYVVARLPDGRLHSYDTATGAPVASRPAGPGAGLSNLHLVGDLVLWWGEGAVLHAHDLVTLSHRWSAEPSVRRYAPAAACGALICLTDRARVVALAPDRGQPAWSAQWLPSTDLRRVNYEAGPRWGEHLLVHVELRGGDQSWLVDPATGVPVLALPGWRPQPAPPDVPLLTRYADRVAWFARPRADQAGVEVLGAIDRAAPRYCQTAGQYLACYSRPGVQVWQIG